MNNPTSIQTYTGILDELGLSDNKLSKLNIDHFTENEGSKRDEIVKQYFGEDGIERLIETIISTFESIDKQTLLDLGAGSGTFLFPLVMKSNIDHVSALDATPKMLEMIANKFGEAEYSGDLSLIAGDMEQVTNSLRLNRRHDPSIPLQYSQILSTLALHHIPDIDAVFQGMTSHLTTDGKAIVIDAVLSDVSRMEPSEEHAHDGFDPQVLIEMASKYFNTVEIRILDIKCQETASKRGTDLFLLELSDPKR